MQARLRKLGFVALLLTWLAFGGPTVNALPPATNGWCYCYDPRASNWYNYYIWSYIYYADEAYGPWQGPIDNTGVRAITGQAETYFGFHGADQFCFQRCLNIGINNADDLCDLYGNANHHIQVAFAWHWEDTDGDFYNAGGWYDSSPAIIWCQ